jgi:hypothetical protein
MPYSDIIYDEKEMITEFTELILSIFFIYKLR